MDRDLIRFNVLRNALYHTSRRLTFDRWSRWCNFIVIMLGAAALSDVAKWMDRPWLPALTGLLTAIVGALQLVFDFAGKARDHQALQRDYYHLLADIERTIDPAHTDVAEWTATMTRIAGDEPPVLRALDAKAYNDAIAGSGLFGEGERIVIPFHHRLFGQFWAFEGYNYRKVCEVGPSRR